MCEGNLVRGLTTAVIVETDFTGVVMRAVKTSYREKWLAAAWDEFGLARAIGKASSVDATWHHFEEAL